MPRGQFQKKPVGGANGLGLPLGGSPPGPRTFTPKGAKPIPFPTRGHRRPAAGRVTKGGFAIKPAKAPTF